MILSGIISFYGRSVDMQAKSVYFMNYSLKSESAWYI